MFIIVSWGREDGKDTEVVCEEMEFVIENDFAHAVASAKTFVTEEEAQEYCNTKLDGYYKVVELEV